MFLKNFVMEMLNHSIHKQFIRFIPWVFIYPIQSYYLFNKVLRSSTFIERTLKKESLQKIYQVEEAD